jgi:transcriptional regulator with XRE-family HTH domain
MINIGRRLRKIRLAKNMSQNDVRKACGLLACYISRVENGVTIPSLETLERLAQAFQMPLHDLVYQITFHVPKTTDPVDVPQEGKAEGTNERTEPHSEESNPIQLDNGPEGQLSC